MNGFIAGGLIAATVLSGVPLILTSGNPEPSKVCATSTSTGSVVPAAASAGDLNANQLKHAATIIQVGRTRHVSDKGIVIALSTALQESRLRIYANDGRGNDLAPEQHGIGASMHKPHDAVGTDHGSLGIFQQQWPWWGSMRELMDPAGAAGLFYSALVHVPGWAAMPVTTAAQSVQRSAYPEAYADDEPLARRLLTQLGSGIAEISADCAALPGDGAIHFPLAPGSGYLDQRNFGHTGGRWSSFHTGTDLSVACGTPVLAATSGTVTIRTDQPWAGRWLVTISTGPGKLTTWYAHMRRVLPPNDARVSGGQRIGEVGDLGNATGCHLHFEVHPHGGSIYQDPTNPTIWLRQHAGTLVTK